MIDFQIEINRTQVIRSLNDIFIQKPIIKISLSSEIIEFIAWGDPIYDEKFEQGFLKHPEVLFIINNLFGHYYYLFLNKMNNILYAGNSLFSILPVYYIEKGQFLWLSNDPLNLQDKVGMNSINKRFILENILFNYPLFNQSYVERVFLLPANHYLKIKSDKIHIIKHLAIEDFFLQSPVPWRKAADRVSDIFIEASAKYFPEKPFLTSLTGGFDGRALVSCGLRLCKNFSTYCFGSGESEDIIIAKKLSDIAKTEFIRINLDVEYIKNFSKECGLDFIKGSYGTSSFSRAHYLYAAKKLAGRTDYIITGNFGSEVLREPHEQGVVIGSNLLSLFKAKNFNDGINLLKTSQEWNWINKDQFIKEWDSLIEDLRTLPCFAAEDKDLSRNQQFYKIIFNEVFRKYFGAEIVNQFQYFANRTPFLDIGFLKEILGTGLSGVNSDFLSGNPLKRFKGQVLYAHIINKTFPFFGNEMTDKGYPPSFLLNFTGNLKLTKSFIYKKLKMKRKSISDPYSVNSAYHFNRSFWENQEVNGDIFNKIYIYKRIQNPLVRRDSLFIAISQAFFSNYFNNNR